MRKITSTYNEIISSILSVINIHGTKFTVGDTINFKGSDDNSVIIGFGIYYDNTYMVFSNPDFGEHNINETDLIVIN